MNQNRDEIIVGTSHFVDLPAAIRYYKVYGYSPNDVRRKVEAGDIHIGPPALGQDERFHLDPAEGRYSVIGPPLTQV